MFVGSGGGDDVRWIWVIVKVMVPFWVLNIVRHLILFRVPKKGTIILTTTRMVFMATNVMPGSWA